MPPPRREVVIYESVTGPNKAPYPASYGNLSISRNCINLTHLEVEGKAMNHWDAVLAELIEERKKLDALIELATQRAKLGGGTGRSDTGEIRSDAFFAMKAPEAIKRFLSMSKAPKSPKEIADGLVAGGYQHTSKDLPNTLRTALRRMLDEDEVVQVGGDWGLAEWYPGRRIKKGKPGNGDAEGTATLGLDESSEPGQPS
jgi:hypothetical protein